MKLGKKVSMAILMLAAAVAIMVAKTCFHVEHSAWDWVADVSFYTAFVVFAVMVWNDAAVKQKRQAWVVLVKRRVRIIWVNVRIWMRRSKLWRFIDNTALVLFICLIALATGYWVFLLSIGASVHWWGWVSLALLVISLVSYGKLAWQRLYMSRHIKNLATFIWSWLKESWKPLLAASAVVIMIAFIGRLVTEPRASQAKSVAIVPPVPSPSQEAAGNGVSARQSAGMVTVQSEKTTVSLPSEPMNAVIGSGVAVNNNFGTINYGTASNASSQARAESSKSEGQTSVSVTAGQETASKSLTVILNAPKHCIGATAETPIIVPAHGLVDCPGVPSGCYLAASADSDLDAIRMFFDGTPYDGPRQTVHDVSFENSADWPVTVRVQLTYNGQYALN